ncbi:MAG: HAMP domain-containing histidine kinase [Ruminococcaceae bacterium]|nr:HAMP domain-containing histidine kinase [Oscillospiraceae bacterium]
MGRFARDFNHMAARLQENMTALEESVAAQERFMGSFAHEMKTPMTSIIGYADLLRSQALEAADSQEAANYIFTEARRLERLSLWLLQLYLTKHEKPEMERVEVGDLAQRLVQRLRPIYKKEGIRLECKTKPGQWLLNRELMESVLINLMDNARKAMEHGGSIAVFVDFPEDSCRIRVVDNGRGMPPEAMEHLTDAFYRVDKSRSRAQGGVGLGLSLCKEILQWHMGELCFESAPGRGTCVSVILGGSHT